MDIKNKSDQSKHDKEDTIRGIDSPKQESD